MLTSVCLVDHTSQLRVEWSINFLRRRPLHLQNLVLLHPLLLAASFPPSAYPEIQ